VALDSLAADDAVGFCGGCARTVAACGGRTGGAIFVGACGALEADEGGEGCANAEGKDRSSTTPRLGTVRDAAKDGTSPASPGRGRNLTASVATDAGSVEAFGSRGLRPALKYPAAPNAPMTPATSMAPAWSVSRRRAIPWACKDAGESGPENGVTCVGACETRAAGVCEDCITGEEAIAMWPPEARSLPRLPML